MNYLTLFFCCCAETWLFQMTDYTLTFTKFYLSFQCSVEINQKSQCYEAALNKQAIYWHLTFCQPAKAMHWFCFSSVDWFTKAVDLFTSWNGVSSLVHMKMSYTVWMHEKFICWCLECLPIIWWFFFQPGVLDKPSASRFPICKASLSALRSWHSPSLRLIGKMGVGKKFKNKNYDRIYSLGDFGLADNKFSDACKGIICGKKFWSIKDCRYHKDCTCIEEGFIIRGIFGHINHIVNVLKFHHFACASTWIEINQIYSSVNIDGFRKIWEIFFLESTYACFGKM